MDAIYSILEAALQLHARFFSKSIPTVSFRWLLGSSVQPCTCPAPAQPGSTQQCMEQRQCLCSADARTVMCLCTAA